MAERLLTKEIISADPGVDDAVAILTGWAAMENPAVVATFGNASTDQTLRNLQTLSTFECANRKSDNLTGERDVFVGANRVTGSQTPFDVDVQFIHGMGAMNGLTDNPLVPATPSMEMYVHMADNYPARHLNLLSLGAMTEVFAAVNEFDFPDKVNSLTIMGGALVQQGNVAPHVEANFRHDPIALKRTIKHLTDKGVPILLVPLDVTEDQAVEFTYERVEALTQNLVRRGSPNIANYMNRLVGPGTTYTEFYRTREETVDFYSKPPRFKKYNGALMHDLTAVMAQLHPELFQIEEYPVVVGTDGSVSITRPSYMQTDGRVLVAGAFREGGAEKYWQLTEDYLASHYK